MSLLASYGFAYRYLSFLNACGIPDAGNYIQPMLDAYQQPQRSYHNNTHISFMLDKLTADKSVGKITLNDWEEKCVTLAIWWHDYVYDPRAKDNEVQSIQAWEAFADQVAPALDLYKYTVSMLIHATISHKIPENNPAQSISPEVIAYFLDLDLAILASDTEVYRTYANNIRAEYIHFPLDDYRKGRFAVLKMFATRDKIFLSSSIEGKETGMEDMEAKARRNLAWEIAELESGRLPAR